MLIVYSNTPWDSEGAAEAWGCHRASEIQARRFTRLDSARRVPAALNGARATRTGTVLPPSMWLEIAPRASDPWLRPGQPSLAWPGGDRCVRRGVPFNGAPATCQYRGRGRVRTALGPSARQLQVHTPASQWAPGRVQVCSPARASARAVLWAGGRFACLRAFAPASDFSSNLSGAQHTTSSR